MPSNLDRNLFKNKLGKAANPVAKANRDCILYLLSDDSVLNLSWFYQSKDD